MQAERLRLIEDEIAEPTGIAPGSAPPLRASGVLMSPDCGVLYKIGNASGLKYVPHNCHPFRLPSLTGRHQ